MGSKSVNILNCDGLIVCICLRYHLARSNMTQAEMEDMRYWYDYVDKGNKNP